MNIEYEKNELLEGRKRYVVIPVQIKCANCGWIFLWRFSGKKPKYCANCRDKGLRSSELIDHYREGKVKELSLKCKECGGNFLWQRKGRRPESCPECGKKNNRQMALLRYYRKRYGGTDEG